MALTRDAAFGPDPVAGLRIVCLLQDRERHHQKQEFH
jgi:hypothetical protein